MSDQPKPPQKKETEHQRVLRLAQEVRDLQLQVDVQSSCVQDLANEQLALDASVNNLRATSTTVSTDLDLIMTMLGIT
jgi:hypothetical protein